MTKSKIRNRKIVIVNQAVNYLTIGIVNEFIERFDKVALITGSIHVQGEELKESVQISWINKFTEKALLYKLTNWIIATVRILFLLLTKYRKYEVFFVPNPPIAYLLMLFLPNRFSILMWDVYPDTLKTFGVSENNILYSFWTWANKKLFERAYRVYTIGNQIAGLIARYVSKEKITIMPLWTTFSDFESIPKNDNFFLKEHGLSNKFVIQYSGNIGITHNVEVLVEVAKVLREEEEIYFQIIGRGNRLIQVKSKVQKLDLKNCKLLPFQEDEVFPYSLSAADVGVVVLDDKTSKGSVPSKTYNLMAAAKPILYIASTDSELYEYAQKYENGACFHSSEIKEIAEFILKVAGSQNYYRKLSERSLMASKQFKRTNAADLAEQYLVRKDSPAAF